MKKVKALFTDLKGDPVSIFLLIWSALLATLVVACSIKIIYAFATGQANFENITLF